jgi:ubiquitin carboxyl-terminal hydrolase 8
MKKKNKKQVNKMNIKSDSGKNLAGSGSGLSGKGPEIFHKYADQGLVGLANLGNTCFMNSTLQILSHCYELNEFLDTDYKGKLKNKFESLLFVEYDQLRKMLWSNGVSGPGVSNGVSSGPGGSSVTNVPGRFVTPVKFLQCLQKLARIKKMDLFTGYAQNDMPEFLIFLIDSFHESLSREVNMTISGSAINTKDHVAIKCYEMVKQMYSKSYSEIWRLFYGIQVSQIVCLENGAELSMNAEPFFMIHASIPHGLKTPHLYDCLNDYVRGEVLEGDNAWYNEATKQKQSVKKQIRFWSLPAILVIDLKRINKYNFANKNQVHVDFPLENMDMSGYVEGYKRDSYVYDLFGVANHYGGTQGGHYTAFVKNANGQWYLYNDSQVTLVREPAAIITPHAYCFFYRKKTNA